MIICSFVLGYIGPFLPVTRIQYQIVTEGPSTTDKPTIASSQGFSSMYGDKYGRDALPCLGTFAVSSSSINLSRLHPFWNSLGRGLWVAVFSLWMSYVVRRKVPLAMFGRSLVVLVTVSIVLTIILTPDQPMCNPNEQYQVISFGPFWPTFIIFLGAILFGIRAVRSMKSSVPAVSGVVDTGNLQP